MTDALPDQSPDEMRVVAGLPATNTMLLATPADSPVEGFEETEGETKKNGFWAVCGAAPALSGSGL